MKCRCGYLLCATIIILNVLISCSKANTDSTSARLSLLQHTWTGRATALYYPDGTPFARVRYNTNTTWTFTKDFNFVTSDPATSTSYRPYQLMPGDTTLIFVNTFTTPHTYDTNYITSLTEHVLIYHGVDDLSQLITRDTLTR